MSSSETDGIKKSKEKKKSPLGLNSEERSIPLKSIKVDVQITGYVAEVSSTLAYFNTEETPVEAVFTFPVDDGSAVFQFEANIDGRHIVAEIQEREQAQLTYNDAIENGMTAMLLKEENSAGDIFSCMLGNLPAKKEASLMMKYVIELPQEPDGRLKFTLPTVLNPRYSPDASGSVAAEGAIYVPPSKVPYEFSMTATVKGYHKVTSVTSDTITLDVRFEENNKIAKVNLGDDFKFDHDLGLIVQYKSPYLPQIILESGNPEAEGLLKEEMLMISFQPDLKEVAMATNGEYIFVIDRSGSMAGDKIRNAKEALFLFLKSLPTNCYFNVISFGSHYSSLFSSGSVKYTEANLKKAIKLQKEMDANMECTDILKPLEHVFSTRVMLKHPRRVVVLTDGEVCNTQQVIGLVRKESMKTNTRVFTVGIGYGASSALVKGVARNGGGKSEFIADKDRIQPKVISLLKCAMQPAITDISIDWDLPPGVTPVTIPTELPSIIAPNERLTLYAILQNVNKDTIHASSSISLKGMQDGKNVSHTLTFTLCKTEDISKSAPIHRLATKLEIKLLQDKDSVDDVSRKKIVSLSCQGNAISKYTSFVAIDTEGRKVEGKAVQKSCPVPSLSRKFIRRTQESTTRCYDMYQNVYCSVHLNQASYASYNQSSLPQSYDHGSAWEGKTRENSQEWKALREECDKRKKKRGLCGYGLRLPKIFSKKAKDEADSVVTDCVDITLKVDESETNKVEEDRGDNMSQGGGGNATEVGRKQSPETAGSIYSQLKDDRMITMIGLQQLQGEWTLSDQLLQLLGVTTRKMEKLSFSKDSSVICTVLVLAWLRKEFSERKEEWQMIEAKALSWLSSHDPRFTAEAHIKACQDIFT